MPTKPPADKVGARATTTQATRWGHKRLDHSFAGTPTLLPHDVLASVLSTPSIWTGSPPSSPLGVSGSAVSTLPSFAGTPARALRPACLVPLTTEHTPTCLASCGVSVTSHTPSLGVRPRLSPQAAHDDWNPGQLGFQSLR
jgi:hypothetical protein